MSIFDSTHSASGDSRATKRAKTIIQNAIRNEFKSTGLKVVDIKEECPAFFDKPYHADLAVLTRSVEVPNFYCFFIVEIDSKLGHRTFLKDRREDERAQQFLKHSGTFTIRFNLEDIVGEKKLSDFAIFTRIYNDVLKWYMYPFNEEQHKRSENNMNFAIRLKENAFTKCKGCDHLAVHHNLNGCEYKQTNKMKLKCHCNEPFFRSDA